ncbi:MAG: hypothetical protein NTX00_01635 [Candidatus Parcubacteria bacterium]|nr:hypothetical protein [Candidatus Parcubacteria bacterium]
MTERTKKILIIIGFIILTLLIAFAIYYLFFRQLIAPTVPVVPVNLPPTAGLPTLPPALNLVPYVPPLNLPPGIRPEIPSAPIAPAPAFKPFISNTAAGGLTNFQTLVDLPSHDLFLNTNGKDLIYYDPATGFFYTLTPDGQKNLLSNIPFRNVSKSTFSPNRQKAILEYPNGSKIIYDFNQKQSVTLPSQWKDFVFSNDSQKIAFKDMKIDAENRYLAVADTKGGNYNEIEMLGDKDGDVYMTWSPNNQFVALSRDPLDGDRSIVYPIGFNGENFRSLTVEGRDMRFDWSPSGNKLVYSVYNSVSNYNPELWVVNSSPDLLGTGRYDLGIKTWADKCAFASEDTLYCAVPRTLDKGTGFRPDLADNTPDDYYKINIAKGTAELAAQPLFDTTVAKMIISSDGKTLYWLEKNTGLIKKMDL